MSEQLIRPGAPSEKGKFPKGLAGLPETRPSEPVSAADIETEKRFACLKAKLKSAPNKLSDLERATAALEDLRQDVGAHALMEGIQERGMGDLFMGYLSEVEWLASNNLYDEKAQAFRNAVSALVSIYDGGESSLAPALQNISLALMKSLSRVLDKESASAALEMAAHLADAGIAPYNADDLKGTLESYLRNSDVAQGYYALTGAIMMSSPDEELRAAAAKKERKRVKLALRCLEEGGDWQAQAALELISLFGNGRTYLLDPIIQMAGNLAGAINGAPAESEAERTVFASLINASEGVAMNAADLILNPSEDDPEGAVEVAKEAASMLRALSGIGVRAKMAYGCFDPQDAESEADSIADVADTLSLYDAPAAFEFLGDNATGVLQVLKSKEKLAEMEEKGQIILIVQVDMDIREGEDIGTAVGRVKSTLLGLQSLEAKVNVHFAGADAKAMVSQLAEEGFLVKKE
ncbi:MAG: hypothetical protein V1827_03010 [Candidatus Micrarchaeota archaeon]